ncbi:GGDEF domain-containing protein [Marinimicrobium locisalis]|uniref:GGDEF domain-containing protein n=1 Tax=Marinimicrobium locisalis TaxID=546022 RepID=UPI0032220D19
MALRFTLEKALAVLILLTVVAVVGERAILKTTLTLDASDYVQSHYSDQQQEKGGSSSELLEAEALEGRCELRPGINYPFCGFELIIDEDRVDGLDLRNYDHLKLWFDYRGPTPTVRFYMRNHDPVYSTPEILDSTKYNQLIFDADRARGGEPLEFSMTDFFVASWWFQRHGLKPEMTQPQFDNIVIIEVQTGSNHEFGEHWFRLEKVELTGQLLSSETWYRGIMAIWVTLALGFLGGRLVLVQRELKRKAERERELIEINALLDSRGKDLEEQAKTDPLTGAFNRKGVEEAVRLGLEDWRRERKPLSVIMFDLDHFKKLNDTCGHAVGDRVLTQLSSLVQENVRSGDRFARWGGEEFVLVCSNTDLSDANRTAEKLCALIAAHDFGETNGLKVSASFGVASLCEGESLDELFDRVDEALYDAKGRGRNCVVVSRR